MDKVHEHVGESDEEGKLQEVVEWERCFGWGIVELCISMDLGKEEGDREDSHDGHSKVGLADLEPNLVLEELGMGEGGVVEDEKVREPCEKEIDDEPEQPTIGISRAILQSHRARTYQVIKYKLTACLQTFPRAQALMYASSKGSRWKNWVAGV